MIYKDTPILVFPITHPKFYNANGNFLEPTFSTATTSLPPSRKRAKEFPLKKVTSSPHSTSPEEINTNVNGNASSGENDEELPDSKNKKKKKPNDKTPESNDHGSANQESAISNLDFNQLVSIINSAGMNGSESLTLEVVTNFWNMIVCQDVESKNPDGKKQQPAAETIRPATLADCQMLTHNAENHQLFQAIKSLTLAISNSNDSSSTQTAAETSSSDLSVIICGVREGRDAQLIDVLFKGREMYQNQKYEKIIQTNAKILQLIMPRAADTFEKFLFRKLNCYSDYLVWIRNLDYSWAQNVNEGFTILDWSHINRENHTPIKLANNTIPAATGEATNKTRSWSANATYLALHLISKRVKYTWTYDQQKVEKIRLPKYLRDRYEIEKNSKNGTTVESVAEFLVTEMKATSCSKHTPEDQASDHSLKEMMQVEFETTSDFLVLLGCRENQHRNFLLPLSYVHSSAASSRSCFSNPSDQNENCDNSYAVDSLQAFALMPVENISNSMIGKTIEKYQLVKKLIQQTKFEQQGKSINEELDVSSLVERSNCSYLDKTSLRSLLTRTAELVEMYTEKCKPPNKQKTLNKIYSKLEIWNLPEPITLELWSSFDIMIKNSLVCLPHNYLTPSTPSTFYQQQQLTSKLNDSYEFAIIGNGNDWDCQVSTRQLSDIPFRHLNLLHKISLCPSFVDLARIPTHHLKKELHTRNRSESAFFEKKHDKIDRLKQIKRNM